MISSQNRTLLMALVMLLGLLPQLKSEVRKERLEEMGRGKPLVERVKLAIKII